jgi:steroid 5-alpha reductase family enzyme
VVATLSLSHRNQLLQPNPKFLSVSNIDNLIRVGIVNGIVILWGTRLALYLFSRVLTVGEDKRLRTFFREKDEPYFDTKRSFYPIKLSSFWIIQALWGFICMLPVTYLNSLNHNPLKSNPRIINIISSLSSSFPSMFIKIISRSFFYIPLIGATSGFLIEAIADYQKNKYRDNKLNAYHWCDVGLWKYSRHPNCK